MIHLLVQVSNFKFGLEIHLVIVGRTQAVSVFLTVLAHHDNGGLDGCKAGQHKVEENIGVRIEWVSRKNEGIEQHPHEKDRRKDRYECPAASKVRDPVGQPLAQTQPRCGATMERDGTQPGALWG